MSELIIDGEAKEKPESANKLLSADEYQESSKRYRLSTYTPEAAIFGLLSEAGELAGVFQKFIRGDYSDGMAATKTAQELGDILWHVAAVASDNGWKLSDLMQENIDKLESRRIRGTIMGSGDNR